ncbi:unnamed protein product [Nezara viridula]|uniref:Uncharacterized protein n=1 Tax=Nezara viridula TaxID=85310 RepID=A0A9P0H471_NEZVI|nr:unnamed protein product [Nezara viridula]
MDRDHGLDDDREVEVWTEKGRQLISEVKKKSRCFDVLMGPSPLPCGGLGVTNDAGSDTINPVVRWQRPLLAALMYYSCSVLRKRSSRSELYGEYFRQFRSPTAFHSPGHLTIWNDVLPFAIYLSKGSLFAKSAIIF